MGAADLSYHPRRLRTARHGVEPLPNPSADVTMSRLNVASHAPSPFPYFLSETR